MKISNLNLNHSKWMDYQLTLDNQILTSQNLKYLFTKFWSEVISNNLTNDQFILIQLKIKLSNGLFRSISHVQTVKNTDYETLLESFKIFWEIKSEEYHILKLDSIIFTYKILPLDSEIKQTKISPHPNIKTAISPFLNLGGYNLPISMDLTR